MGARLTSPKGLLTCKVCSWVTPHPVRPSEGVPGGNGTADGPRRAGGAAWPAGPRTLRGLWTGGLQCMDPASQPGAVTAGDRTPSVYPLVSLTDGSGSADIRCVWRTVPRLRHAGSRHLPSSRRTCLSAPPGLAPAGVAPPSGRQAGGAEQRAPGKADGAERRHPDSSADGGAQRAPRRGRTTPACPWPPSLPGLVARGPRWHFPSCPREVVAPKCLSRLLLGESQPGWPLGLADAPPRALLWGPLLAAPGFSSLTAPTCHRPRALEPGPRLRRP